MEKSRNLGLVGASTTEWQLITPRGGPCGPPPYGIGLTCIRRYVHETTYAYSGNKQFFTISYTKCQKLSGHMYCFSTFAIFNTQPLWMLIQGRKEGQENHYIQPNNFSSALVLPICSTGSNLLNYVMK